MRELERRLAAYGSDFSRWPDGANEGREAALADPDFRRAWEEERELDRRLAAERGTLEAEIARSGALVRLQRFAVRRKAGNYLADIRWRRVAAGVLIAGMLGGVFDLMLPASAADPVEMALVDPLAGFDAQ